METEEQLWAKLMKNNNIPYFSGSYYGLDTVLTSLYTILILALTTACEKEIITCIL